MENKATATNVEDAYPASPVQEGLLFHSLYEQGSGVYLTQIICSLRGLQPRLFEEAWQRVIERHQILRTAFVWMSVEKPLQVVGRRVRVAIKQVDLRGLSVVEREARFKSDLAADRRCGFDVSKAPLMRLGLWQESDDLYKFVWTHHHLLLDGWAAAIVLKEVLLVYEALSRRTEPRLGPAWPYKNYIAWLQRQDLSAAEAYWHETLANFRAPTPLKDSARPPGAERQEGYGTRTLRLAKSTTTHLHAFGRAHQLTLNTLVQGAWAILLSRYTGREDVCFGAVAAGRPTELPGVDQMVGLFINTLPVRVQLAPQMTVGDWLSDLQAQQSRARSYEYSPLSEVQRWSEIGSGQQLFNHYIVFENYPIDQALKSKIKDLTIDSVESLEQSSYPLVLAPMPGEKLTLQIHHDRSQFGDDMVDRLLFHVAMLLEAFVANPEQRLSQLPLTATSERRQLLYEFNQSSAAESISDACIHELFEEQVRRTPHAVAVIDDNRKLTYAELNAGANQLARHLRALGVDGEVRVGLCVKRSVSMVQGLLGILKAGGVYLPLDAAYPRGRLEFMLDDSGAEVLVTEAGMNESLVTRRDLRVVDINGPEVTSQSTKQLNVALWPANLAYIIYTSGSTGVPKGVAVTHQAAANHLRAIQKVFAFTNKDRCLQFASQSFDVSLEQMLAPLLAGARIVLRGDEVWGAADLARRLRDERLTVVNFPPAFWQQITSEALSGELDSESDLRLVIVGGDLMPAETARRWMSTRPGQARLLNAYGPTEATITATTFEATERAAAELPGAFPIGRAVGARVLYILDTAGQPLPLGVWGELHIGGPLLARGYLNRAALTAAAFVPDPFSAEFGGRLYRTGDVGRWLADGTVEVAGRADQQVKIRGFRVELGEIEAALYRHSSVSEAVAIVQDDAATENKQIVAYVVTKIGSELTNENWREFLKAWLPDYMIPAAFVNLEKLPLTPNGKVDRSALPTPESVKPAASEDSRNGFNSETEKQIANVWAEILGVEQVDPGDNFFELGGHSLIATQVVSRLRKKYKVELPFRVLFEEPTVRAIAHWIEESIAEKSQQTAGEEATADSTIPPAPRNSPLPLSFAQERFWFLQQLDPESSLYNVAGAVTLSGSLDKPAFHAALNEVVRRHEILRTSFASASGQPSQYISPVLELPLPLTDLSSLPADERMLRALQLAQTEARQPFDLMHAPLLRAQLLRLEETEHVLLLTIHHIVSDGWSLGLFVREMAVLYEAYSQGRSSPLAELSIQYADYAVWHRKQFASEALEGQLNYWREQLRGAGVLELPTDRPRPLRQRFRGRRHYFNIPRVLTDSLAELSRQQSATLFMTLLAAFQVLLSRYSGQSDISVGTPMAGRTRIETEKLIGLFVNTLVMRARFNANESFLHVLEGVREVCLAAQRHQELPFEQLVEAIQPERALNRHPLFDVMFVMQNPLLPVLHLPGLQLSPLPLETGGAKFDLTLEVEQTDDGLSATMEFDTDLFDPETVQRLTANYVRLLEAIIADPNGRVATLPLLGEDERRRLIHDCNDTARRWPVGTYPDMFRQQVQRTPDAIAVEGASGTRLTYAELDERSEQLARHLRSINVGPESIAAVLMDRSEELIVTLLGVMKSGAAYLPLDPTNPMERLRFMLADSGAAVILTKRAFVDALPEHNARLFCLDDNWGSVPVIEGVSEIAPDNLAYIIYTSGSTGVPKGVMVTHGGLANYLRWCAEAYETKTGIGTLVHSPIGFDLTVTSLWLPLISGTRALLVNEGVEALENLADALRQDEEFTLLKLTPAHLEPLAAELMKRNAVDQVQRLVIGGEALYSEQLRWWREHSPRTLVVNEYGPTETVVGCCVYERAVDQLAHGAVPIGRPIANTRLYVLSQQMELVPEGVWGELYVGGSGVARGYLNRTRLTAERFVPDAFSSEAGARLYQTGDVVRWKRGELEYAGRADGQIKVRGYRVETGEVEAVLRGQELIRDAAVVVRDSVNGKQLVAYVVAEEGAELNVAGLREHLRPTLPEYMIPATFMLLDELPLTANGKVDRLVLLKLDAKALETGETFTAPRTDTEELVAAIWRDVLELESIGVNDNFFERGGHSLLVMQVVSRVRDLFQIELPLRKFFETATVANVAVLIESLRKSGAAQPPSIRPYAHDGKLPLSFEQERLWFLDKLQPDSPYYNISIELYLQGRLDVAAMDQVMNEVIRRHEVLRTRFEDADGYPAQVIVPALTSSIPLTDLSHLSGVQRETQVRKLAEQEAQRPFSLSTGPLLRAQLLRLSAAEHVLLLTMHHIVSDGWSMGVLIREAGALYGAYSQGRSSPMDELSIQYGDYAMWQREWLTGEVLQQQLSYWKQQLAGVPVLELPADKPRPAVQSLRGAHEPLVLPKSLSEELESFSKREGVTLFMTLLAAFQTLLSYYAKQEDISVGTDIANRSRSETEGLIGFFINQLVLRTDFSGNPNFRELLGRVREVTLNAYAHQDMPFGMLIEALNPERNLKHAPLFQTKFVLQNTPQQTLRLPELTLTFRPPAYVSAKFDLTLLMEETASGLSGNFEFNTDLFEATTISRMGEMFAAILRAVVARPEISIDELKRQLADIEKEKRHAERSRRNESRRRRLMSVKPATVNFKQEAAVRKELLRSDDTLPLLIEAQDSDVNLVAWSRSNRASIEADLLKHGALLFRGFKIDLTSELELFARSLCSNLFQANGEHPREHVNGKVYTPVFYPPDQHLLWHNENSFNHQWPQKIWFSCVRPAEQGGETPIVDSRKVWEHLDPAIRERFVQKKVMYVRNYDSALGLDWQTVFQTSSREAVEEFCRRSAMSFEWKDNNRLKTQCIRPAAIKHPATGQMSWFNQAQHWHVSCLDPLTRQSMLSLFDEKDLPRNCYYGDGSSIEDSVMKEILDVYRSLEASFPWRQGDILMLDNLLTAHARNQFVGERKMLVVMGDMLSYDDV